MSQLLPRLWLAAAALVGASGVGLACAANPQPQPEANANSNPAVVQPQPEPEPPPRWSDSDTYASAEAKLAEDLAMALKDRDLNVVFVPDCVIPSEAEIKRNVDSKGRDWFTLQLARGHRAEYMRPHALSITDKFKRVVTRDAKGELEEEQAWKEDLSRRVLESQGDRFDPATAAALGQFKSAKAVLFSQVTASFQSLDPRTPFSREQFWCRGTYQFRARLIMVDTATTVWTNNLEWTKVFLVTNF